MKKNNQKSFIAVALALTATQAVSGQMFNQTTSDPWSGVYFGAYLGGGAGYSKSVYNQVQQSTSATSVNGSISLSTKTNSTTSGQLSALNTSGSVADLFIGYNYHHDNAKLLIGAQFEGTVFSDITTKSAKTLITNSNVTNVLTNVTVSNYAYNTVTSRYNLDSILSVVARAGVLARPDTLIYGLIGPSEGNFVIPDAVEFTFFNTTQWKIGMNAGGGIEHKLNDNWSILAEYRYLYFNNINNSSQVSAPASTSNFAGGVIVNNTTTTSTTVTSWNNNFSMSLGKIGVAYRC